MANLDETGLDETLRLALLGAAGELQTDVAEIGAAHVTEADLRRALRRAWQAQLGPVVRVEEPAPPTESWSGRVGAFDLAIRERLVCEVKWCRDPDKLGEAIWDALKLSPISSAGVASYLVYAAPIKVWTHPGTRPAELFSDGTHDVSELLKKYAAFWKQWLPTGPKSPRIKTIQRMLTTDLIATVPIHTPDGHDWELRGVRVKADGSPMSFGENGLVLEEPISPESLAPPSRFIDTDADIQIDPATLPENRALLKKLDRISTREEK